MGIVQLPFVDTLRSRLAERNPLIQVVVGPRQVGKTTGIHLVLKAHDGPHHYVSADDTIQAGGTFIEEHWQNALLKGGDTLLVIDEIQKIPNWPETLKKLWDDQRTTETNRLRCVVAGSSSLKIQQGLTESLAGRFEKISVFHWSYRESEAAYGISFDDYLRLGGYPGSYPFVSEFTRWHAYVKQSIVDMVIGQDILGLRSVRKPALFRQAFELLCHFPAQEVSYTKLLGQLQDRGNTDLVKHYIDLYEAAFLFRTLPKYSGRPFTSRRSSPKILPLCPALYTVAEGPIALDAPDKRGRVFELAVGAAFARLPGTLSYWRERNKEVDFIYEHAGRLFAIEVKSGRKKHLQGLSTFCERYPRAVPVIVTTDNFFDVTDHLEQSLERIFSNVRGV